MYGEETLSRFLLDAGLLSRAQLASVQARAQAEGEPLSRAAVASGALSDDDMSRALAQAHGVPFVVLSPEVIAAEALVLIPEPLSRAHNVVAYARAEEVLEVALLDLADLAALEPLRLRFVVRVRLTDRASMKRALMHYQKYLRAHYGERIAAEARAIVPPDGDDEAALRYSAERLPTQRVVDALLEHALLAQASAVHLEPREGGLLVRYRIGGALHEAMQLPAHATHSIAARLKHLAKLPLASTGAREGRFKILRPTPDAAPSAVGERIAARLSLLPTHAQGERLVLHLAREGEGKRGFTLESLGLRGAALEALERLLVRRRGLLLVCGPEGSGKTTLLYTLADHLVHPRLNVITVEDHIEARLPGAVQTQADEARGIGLAARLRAALRHDPDVIMLSRIDSAEVAELALRAANRGICVLAGLAAEDAAQGIAELLALGMDPALVAASVCGSIGTRVVPELCASAAPHKLTREEINAIEARADLRAVLASLKEEGTLEPTAQWKDVELYDPMPCKECESGFRGRVGLQEVLPLSSTLQECILRAASAEELRAQARQDGYLLLADDAAAKAAQARVAWEEICSV